jgi:hypothetical protein
MWNRKRRETAAQIVAEAMRHVGYRSQPNRQSAFQLPGYKGEPWNGTFVDRVLHDAFGDFAEVRFVSTVTALGYYVKRNRVFQKPQVGDIVFFNFATDPLHAFEQPHIGIVTEIKPVEHGAFRTVEGETAPGTPQGSQLVDGVFERTRYLHDVIGFVRPTVMKNVDTGTEEPQTVKMGYFTSNPKTRARAIETVQRALNRVRPSWSFNQGKKDGEFKSAFGLYARESAWVRNRGELDAAVIQNLADRTGEFAVE